MIRDFREKISSAQVISVQVDQKSVSALDLFVFLIKYGVIYMWSEILSGVISVVSE